jgi:hypothetical protein
MRLKLLDLCLTITLPMPECPMAAVPGVASKRSADRCSGARKSGKTGGLTGVEVSMMSP